MDTKIYRKNLCVALPLFTREKRRWELFTMRHTGLFALSLHPSLEDRDRMVQCDGALADDIISHLCHNGNCTNPTHWCLENSGQNNRRKPCQNAVYGTPGKPMVYPDDQSFDLAVSVVRMRCTHNSRCFPTNSRNEKKYAEFKKEDWASRRDRYMICLINGI